MAQHLRRPSGAQPGKSFDVAVDDPAWYNRHPVTAEHICEISWPDGKSRLTMTVLVFYEEGKLKAAVHDRDGHRSAFVSASTWADLWGTLEMALREDVLSWRSDKRK